MKDSVAKGSINMRPAQESYAARRYVGTGRLSVHHAESHDSGPSQREKDYILDTIQTRLTIATMARTYKSRCSNVEGDSDTAKSPQSNPAAINIMPSLLQNLRSWKSKLP